MADSMSRGDVLMLKNGDVGVVRNLHENKKYNTCIVEIKGNQQHIKHENGKKNGKKSMNSNGKNCIRIKLNKKNQKHKKTKYEFKKLSGEQLFDKLFILHEMVNEDHIHQNKLLRLQTEHEMLKNKIKEKELELHDLRDRISYNKKYLLLQQSIWTITHPKNIDKTSTPVLLLTYPTFTNSIELFDNLSVRFFNLNNDDYQQKLNECQWDIQIKVISLIQQWIRTYWIEDFYFNADLIEVINIFCNQILKIYGNNNDKYVKLSNMIKKTIHFQHTNERMRNSRELVKKQTFSMMIEEMKSEFQEINNRKIAEQMALIDFTNFANIKQRECLNKQWLNEDERYNLSPNICEMIDSLNRCFKWVQIIILLSPTVEKRGRLIKKFLKISRELLDLNNFHSLSAVFGALRSTPIYKLKNAWKLVPQKHIVFYDELVKLFDTKKNMKNLREAHKTAHAPMVPYTGIFLSELVGIEEAKKDSKAKKAINFDKLVLISQSIENVLIYQKTGYDDIKQDVPMQHFLKNQIYDDIHQMGTIDEDYLYDFSKAAAKQDAEQYDETTIGRIRSVSNSIVEALKLKKS